MTRQRSDYPLDYTGTNGTQHPSHRLAEATADKVKDAADRVEDVAAEVTRQAQIYGAKAQEAVNNFRPYVAKSLKEQPYATLAVATAIAFVLGALWKKK
jgi:ElaB/YqjD/DUF883 family membrane-anchored ribosome-binding protein